MNVIIEYVWLDGNTPEPNLRSKVKVLNFDILHSMSDIETPDWSFDGSSTQQATGDASDCLLRPVKLYPDPRFDDMAHYIVFCEVLK